MRLFTKFFHLVVFLFSSLAIAQTDTVSPKVAATMNAEHKAVILDVREDTEWNDHHIPGAIHIPLGQLNARLSELEAYKNSALITQCRAGNRSRKAQALLKSAGFSNIYNLEGGIEAWDNEGLKTEH